MPSLFDPIQLGAIHAPNRILMAPAHPRPRPRARVHVPTPVMVEYYTQRAAAGLIISEATGMSRQGLGWPYAPGIWTAEQTTAWRPVTDSVHRSRRAHRQPALAHGPHRPPELPGRRTAGLLLGDHGARQRAHTYDGKQRYTEARALRADEIPALLEDYRTAARKRDRGPASTACRSTPPMAT